ncbi:energy transducer TonB [Winogradskyella sp.]|uniref:energy transducer TonB n=1 Tax=Winogradskyella sp. TaxID=1883156 RepID=UPI0025E0138E|nr:energy transducer TonB [Winogradskyella sp.]
MKSIFVILLLLLSINFSFAQAIPNGPFQDYYDSGELKIEGQYKNKKKVGEWKRYYKDGQISRLYSYNKGKLNKEEVSYYKNGKVSNKTEKVGEDYISFGYYKSGELNYEKQQKTGYYKSYYKSGAIDIEANYLEYELVGIWKKHYENGQIKWLVEYKNGYRDGVYKNFYENGDLKLEGNNSKDKLDGEEKRYLANNVLEWKGNYSKGFLAKTWTKYDADGKKIEKIKFKDGVVSKSEFLDVLKPTKVEDGVIERVPIYPGCEALLTNKTRKKCMNQNVAQFIAKNFNTDIAKDNKITGRQKINVIFKINKDGRIFGVKARNKHESLRTEAIRVLSRLPIIKPGMQRGKPVIVPFAIPIVFQVQ